MTTEKTTWKKVMSCKPKDKRRKGIMNNLTEDEITTVIATVDYFGGSTKQVYFDLTVARYRVFDALAMCVMGDRWYSKPATQVLVYAFLKAEGDVDKWIADLRSTDYDVVRGWESLELTC